MPKLLQAAENSPKGVTRIINVTSLSPCAAGIRWSDINFDKTSKDLPKEEQPAYGMLKVWGTKDAENMSYVPLEGYNQSKVANVLFGIAANKRLFDSHGILSLAVHPGVIMTELGRNMSPEVSEAIGEMLKEGTFPVKTKDGGAATSLVAALDPGLGAGEMKDGKENYGAYFIDCQISDKADPRAVSSNEAERLWTLSEELVQQKFVW